MHSLQIFMYILRCLVLFRQSELTRYFFPPILNVVANLPVFIYQLQMYWTLFRTSFVKTSDSILLPHLIEILSPKILNIVTKSLFCSCPCVLDSIHNLCF